MNTPPSSKTMYPTLPLTVLHRSALVTELLQATLGSITDRRIESTGDGSYKVILLCAPAGYGKTTLLADFARHSSLPCCWYFLDSTDENSVLFLHLLITSIRQYFPNFGASLDASLANIAEVEITQKFQYLEIFVENLTKAMATEISDRFVLLLCDYHKIDPQQTTNALVNHFMKHLPPQCTLLLESRSTPNLDFVPFMAQRMVLGIGSDKLCFSSQEIRELALLQHVELTEEEATYLEQTFEGWITGIQLGTRLGNAQIPFSLSSEIQPGREHLFTYLVKHVFAHQPEAYHFLQETSILRQITPPLCNVLLNISDAASYLTHLDKQGLFVTRYQNSSEDIFVCHPILRELLYAELERLAPWHLTELHLRAVELFRGKQDSEAIAHALAAHDFHTAAQIIEAIAARQFAKGDLIILAQWIDALPSEVTSEFPRLLLTRATIFLEESSLSCVQDLLDQALISLQPMQNVQSLQAEIFLAQAKLFMQQGNYSRAQELSRHALNLLSIDEVELRATTYQLLGSCAAYFNNFTASIAELQQALQLHKHSAQTRQIAKLHTLLANFYGMTGHNSLSEHHRTRAIQCWKNLNDEWGKIDDLLGLGAIKARQGAIEEAIQISEQALTLSRGSIHYICGEAYALTNLGDLYQDQDKFQKALVMYEDGLALAHQIDEAYLVHYIICQFARTYLLMNDPHGAKSIIQQIEQHTSSLTATPLYEQALYKFVFGSLLLQTGHADEAYPYLTAAETAFTETKYECIQAMIFSAACLLALDNTEMTLQHIRDAFHLAEECSYEEMVQRELRRCPHLLKWIQKNVPELLQDLIGSNRMSKTIAGKNTKDIPPIHSVNVSQHLPLLSIQALGTPTVYRNDSLLKQWRMAKSMELFFLLLNASKPLYKEQVINALWPGEAELADQTWRSTLHYLRKVLGATCIHAHRGIYTLQLEMMYTVEYDVERFQYFSTQAYTAQQVEDHPAAVHAFEKMIDLYKGDYVASFYSDWCIARRDGLRRTCINARHQLALIAWRYRDLDKSISHWQHIIAMDMMDEIAHEGLTRCYIQQGKHNLALHHYNHYAAFLQNEVGIVPRKTLQSLYQQAEEFPHDQVYSH